MLTCIILVDGGRVGVESEVASDGTTEKYSPRLLIVDVTGLAERMLSQATIRGKTAELEKKKPTKTAAPKLKRRVKVPALLLEAGTGQGDKKWGNG
jgi:uncharacterized small protein (DUF1192 family)